MEERRRIDRVGYQAKSVVIRERAFLSKHAMSAHWA